MICRVRRRSAAGFTLTEMAIVLGVVGVLVAGLWNLISGASQQARDESAASQQTQLINAVKGFLLSSQGQNYMTTNAIPVGNPNRGCAGNCGQSANFGLPLPSSAACSDFADPNWKAFCSFLPPGFTNATVNSYGQTYLIQILRDSTPVPPAQAPNSYSFMILTTGAAATSIPDTSGSRISALIGGDGGFVFNNAVCSAAAQTTVTACGSYGGWTARIDTTGPAGGYGFPAPASGGFVASRSYMSPQTNALNDWLARVKLDAGYNLNTMTVSEYMGGFPLVMGGYNGTVPLSANPGVGDIDMGTYGAVIGGGNINMAGGNINAQKGSILMGGGVIDLNGGMLTSTAGGAENGNDAIVLNATDGNGDAIIQANMPCTIASFDPVKSWVDASDNPCKFAISSNGIAVNGLVEANGFYAGTFIYQASDASFKKNIKPLKDPLSNLMHISPVTFTYKINDRDSMGVIAQDVEKTYPQLVAMGDKGKKYVSYEGFIAPLIGAVQELKKENDELRQQLKDDEARQDRLEQQLREKTAH